MATTHFIVHDKHDNVGVVVVEDVQPGMEVTGWVMETDETITVKALDPVPLGHKIAVVPAGDGDTVLEYGIPIGIATGGFGVGSHVHTHNLRSARW